VAHVDADSDDCHGFTVLLLLLLVQEENLRKLVFKGMAVAMPNSSAIRKGNSTFQRQQVADTIRQVCLNALDSAAERMICRHALLAALAAVLLQCHNRVLPCMLCGDLLRSPACVPALNAPAVLLLLLLLSGAAQRQLCSCCSTAVYGAAGIQQGPHTIRASSR
jgi:hypothetical protein